MYESLENIRIYRERLRQKSINPDKDDSFAEEI